VYLESSVRKSGLDWSTVYLESSVKEEWFGLVYSRVSFETSFDSKQPKLEPKLVSALSETKRLFRLFRFNTETESFDVSIEPKQTEDQPKQFDREHILPFFTENLEEDQPKRVYLGIFQKNLAESNR